MAVALANPRRWPFWLVALGLVALVVAVVAWPRSGQPPNETDSTSGPEGGPSATDPRLTFATEFLNVRPQVKYLGDVVCVRCHDAISRSYHQHPMGRSAEWVRPGSTVDHAAGPHSTFESSGYRLRVIREGDRIWHCTGLTEDDPNAPIYKVPADLSIGSGSRGRSYLTFDRGAAWQSPVSWFGQQNRWDVSPGFDLAKEIRRPIVARCLSCHTDQPEPILNSLNRYLEPPLPVQASIGCERCHGPGELHVAKHESGVHVAPDMTIVNPARLPADLKADVCRQCHLQGAVQVARRGRDPLEYRPGLPWEQFASTFLWHPDLRDPLKSVGQFEQMEASRCFVASKGQLSCTSCHDPHVKPTPAEAPAYFRNRCISCHDSRGCSLAEPERARKDNSCIACHMPGRDSSNVAHVAITDHRILRRPDSGGTRAKTLPAGQMPLLPYRPGPHAPAEAERDRDFAIALGNECARTGGPPGLWRAVEVRLDRSLSRWPDDVEAWLARSRIHGGRNEGLRAIDAARTAVRIDPASEVALIQLAAAAIALEDYETAARAAESLITLNPSSPDHRLTRATAYFSRKEWAKAEADCREAIAIQPVRPNARFMLAVCRHQLGDQATARKELDLALKLTPSVEMRGTLSKWFDQLTK